MYELYGNYYVTVTIHIHTSSQERFKSVQLIGLTVLCDDDLPAVRSNPQVFRLVCTHGIYTNTAHVHSVVLESRNFLPIHLKHTDHLSMHDLLLSCRAGQQ